MLGEACTSGNSLRRKHRLLFKETQMILASARDRKYSCTYGEGLNALVFPMNAAALTVSSICGQIGVA